MKLNIDNKKKFFLIVGIGLGVLLLILGYDSSVRQASALARENSQSLEDELEDTKEKFLGLESRAESTNRILKKEFLPGIKAKIEFPDILSPAPKDQDSAVHLRQELMSLQRKRKNEAARKNLGLPKDWDIGDKIKKNNTPQEISELRLRLAATNAMIKRCIDCNIRRIRKIAQKNAVIEVIEDTPTVVRRIPFLLEFEGDIRSVTAVMLSFQKEGNFLEVISADISDSPGKSVLLARLEMAILRMLDRSQVKEEGALPPVEKGPSRPPRRGGGRRRQRY
jgi:hypothetical protein